MKTEQLNRFKSLLSVPSKTYKEEKIVEYICSEIDNMSGVSFYRDYLQNIYITKGELMDGEFYPMFIAHTDTVHEMVPEIVVKEERSSKPFTYGKTFDSTEFDILKAYTPSGQPTGIGGDYKAGVFIALELLRILPKVKIGLFVSEETGCHGSQRCDVDSLKDVGYAVQFDAPGDHLITRICWGVKLYDDDGEFIKIENLRLRLGWIQWLQNRLTHTRMYHKSNKRVTSLVSTFLVDTTICTRIRSLWFYRMLKTQFGWLRTWLTNLVTKNMSTSTKHTNMIGSLIIPFPILTRMNRNMLKMSQRLLLVITF